MTPPKAADAALDAGNPQVAASSAPLAPRDAVFPVLISLGFCHLLNDLMQSLIPALYPMLKAQLQLDFAQIGMITLAFQLTASLLQPTVGIYTDRRPQPYSLALGMGSTLIGLVLLSMAADYSMVLLAAALVGTGSAVFHPEASRVARMASGGRYGVAQAARSKAPVPPSRAVFYVLVLMLLVFSRNVYSSSLTSFFAFYLIGRFSLPVQEAQVQLFIYMAAIAVGTLAGGAISDRIGRRPMIWISILGALPFTLALPYANLFWTAVLTIVIGIVMASAFPAILVYAHELVPGRVGLISGVFFGFAFGLGGLGAAAMGRIADAHGIAFVYQLCSYLPALGLVAWLLPKLDRQRLG